MMKTYPKVYYSKGSVIDFLKTRTDMDVSKVLTEVIRSYAAGNTNLEGVDMKFNILPLSAENNTTDTNDDNKEGSARSLYLTLIIDCSDSNVIRFVDAFGKGKRSETLRTIFESAIISKYRTKLIENGWLAVPGVSKVEKKLTFDEIIELVKKGTYKITLSELVSSQKTKKRTDAFIERLYRKLGEESIVMTFVNGDEISPEKFKEIHDFDTKIILKCTKTQEESNGESDDKAQETAEAETDVKAQEMAKTATDDEKTEAADAAEAEGDGENQANEASEASESQAYQKEYDYGIDEDSFSSFDAGTIIVR